MNIFFRTMPNWQSVPLAKMQPVIIKSRDGLDLVSYYTLPTESQGKDPRYPTLPLPTVLLVHGGTLGSG